MDSNDTQPSEYQGHPGYDRPILGTLPQGERLNDGHHTYYVAVFCGANEVSAPAELLAIELGSTLRDVGVELITADLYVSPVGIRADYLALHEVWSRLDKRNRECIRLISPALVAAIQVALGIHMIPEDPSSSARMEVKR